MNEIYNFMYLYMFQGCQCQFVKLKENQNFMEQENNPEWQEILGEGMQTGLKIVFMEVATHPAKQN